MSDDSLISNMHIILSLHIVTVITIHMDTMTSIYFITRTSFNLCLLVYALLHLHCFLVTQLRWNLILSFSIFPQNSILKIPTMDLRNTPTYLMNLTFTTLMKLHNWARISLHQSFT